MAIKNTPQRPGVNPLGGSPLTSSVQENFRGFTYSGESMIVSSLFLLRYVSTRFLFEADLDLFRLLRSLRSTHQMESSSTTTEKRSRRTRTPSILRTTILRRRRTKRRTERRSFEACFDEMQISTWRIDRFPFLCLSLSSSLYHLPPLHTFLSLSSFPPLDTSPFLHFTSHPSTSFCLSPTSAHRPSLPSC